ncbi:flavodoxin domain-containing protein [Chloroflexota bacterium]
MGNKVLVTYATNSGSTGEVAEAIAKTLGEEDETQADVRHVKEVDDISSYNAVIVGGPMMMGWHKEAVNFLVKHEQGLSRVPVAYFLTALHLTKTTETSFGTALLFQDLNLAKAPMDEKKLSFREKQHTVASYLGPALKKAPLVKPIGAGFFGGKLDYSKLSFLQKLFVRLIIRAEAGDFRNWEAIREWAESLKL